MLAPAGDSSKEPAGERRAVTRCARVSGRRHVRYLKGCRPNTLCIVAVGDQTIIDLAAKSDGSPIIGRRGLAPTLDHSGSNDFVRL